MKEAAGEANITVITIVLIALVLAVGTPLIRSILSSMSKNACCQSAGGTLEGTVCNDKDGHPISDYWSETDNKCAY